MLDFLRDNWAAIVGTLGAIVVWLNERHKRKTEGKVGLNDATEGMQNMYDKFVTDANYQYDKLNEKIKALQITEAEAVKSRNEIFLTMEDIQKRMEADKSKISNLELKIANYERTIKEYQKKITDYELQVKNLKIELKKQKE